MTDFYNSEVISLSEYEKKISFSSILPYLPGAAAVSMSAGKESAGSGFDLNIV